MAAIELVTGAAVHMRERTAANPGRIYGVTQVIRGDKNHRIDLIIIKPGPVPSPVPGLTFVTFAIDLAHGRPE